MSISGFNAGLIRAEIFNLTNTQREQGNILILIKNNLDILKRNKGNILTNHNILLAQSKVLNIPENIKKSIEDRISETRRSLIEINHQIFSLEN